MCEIIQLRSQRCSFVYVFYLQTIYKMFQKCYARERMYTEINSVNLTLSPSSMYTILVILSEAYVTSNKHKLFIFVTEFRITRDTEDDN